jgi:hypothetical protein
MPAGRAGSAFDGGTGLAGCSLLTGLSIV